MAIASKDSRALTREIFGSAIGWLPWKKPGYELGLWLEKFCLENPDAKGVVLESHGLFTWGDTPEECYKTTIATINKAIDWFALQTEGKAVFGGERAKGGDLDKGYFYLPTLLSDVPDDARVTKEEVFGPALPVYTFKSIDEAIHRDDLVIL